MQSPPPPRRLQRAFSPSWVPRGCSLRCLLAQSGGADRPVERPRRTAVQAPTRCVLGDGTGCAETLDPGPGGRDAPTASPAALRPASGSSWCPPGAVEEQGVWPQHMEVRAGGGQGGSAWGGPLCSDSPASALSWFHAARKRGALSLTRPLRGVIWGRHHPLLLASAGRTQMAHVSWSLHPVTNAGAAPVLIDPEGTPSLGFLGAP